MKVSLNWIKKYVDLDENITDSQIAYDLTLRTVEVENVEKLKDKYHDIVVGKILEVNPHPDADKLKVCKVLIDEKEPVQIVCGGSNLYVDEMVVVSKPGAEVIWHGEGEPVVIKETKMRGVSSYGMICASEEVFLDKLFPPKTETEIVDLKGIDCKPGQNIAEALGLDDTILEIDNKSLTNRPDLWGHYGIAREIAAIYGAKLKPLEKFKIEENLKEYNVTIEEEEKCKRYTATEIEGVYECESPLWMKVDLINAGMRPINLVVDITNYVMLAVGQPTHAFDETHVDGKKIIVRNAKKGEKLLLLDNKEIDLTTDDLVISDATSPLGLAGIKGGRKDSILPETNKVLLEIANFDAKTIRKTDKRFNEKTDAAIRYEKGIDTQRIDDALFLALKLFKEFFPESKILSHTDIIKGETKKSYIEVPKEFLNIRLGKELESQLVINTLTSLGYEVNFENEIYKVQAPTYRSTGDVSIKDDVMGDIARLLSFESFEAKPLPVNFTNAVVQNKVLLERRIREYLSYRCGFNEIFTYPWIDEKYIKASKMDTSKNLELATPPAPELKMLRSSLIPGMLEAISKNIRYFQEFRLFEMTEVYEKGEYHPSSIDETLPIHKKYLTGAIVGKNAKEIFYQVKGVIENISAYTHMESLEFNQIEKPTWADINAYLGITLNGEEVGSMGLLSTSVMANSKIKRTNACIFEINFDKLIPFTSRTNHFTHLPEFPLVEKDLSLLFDENVSWQDIYSTIKAKVKKVEFIEEYKGDKIPSTKKSITLRLYLGKDDATLTTDEINTIISNVLNSLNKRLGAVLREE